MKGSTKVFPLLQFCVWLLLLFSFSISFQKKLLVKEFFFLYRNRKKFLIQNLDGLKVSNKKKTRSSPPLLHFVFFLKKFFDDLFGKNWELKFIQQSIAPQYEFISKIEHKKKKAKDKNITHRNFIPSFHWKWHLGSDHYWKMMIPPPFSINPPRFPHSENITWHP